MRVREQREPPRRAATIRQPHSRKLDRLFPSHEQRQILFDPVADVAKRRITKAVANFERRYRRSRSRSDRPERLRLFVANPNRLGMRIAYVVIVPRGYPIEPTVADPPITGTALRHEKTSRRIGNHIRPWSWRQPL